MILGSIGCALAPKFCGGARTHEISKTQKSFGEIPPRLYFIKIINIFNEVLKPKRKIKILMGINQNMGEHDLEGRPSQVLILAVD